MKDVSLIFLEDTLPKAQSRKVRTAILYRPEGKTITL